MRRWVNGFLALVLTVLCCVTMVLPAYAAEEGPKVSVPVKSSLKGTLPKPSESYTVVPKADNAAYPMPAGSENGSCSMTITGAGTKNFPEITYSRVGVYTYKLSQTAGTNKKCTYDKTEYLLKVTITNKSDYSGLEATVVLRPSADADKVDQAEFTNKYKVESSNTVKTGDESTPALYAALVVISMAVIVALFLTRNRKKTEE